MYVTGLYCVAGQAVDLKKMAFSLMMKEQSNGKIMIPPLDSNAAEVIKNNWAKWISRCIV